MNVGGRPSIYTDELAELICGRVATHDWGIERLCNHYDDLPAASTVKDWRWRNERFSALYDRAKTAQLELFPDSMLDIADNSSGDKIVWEDGSVTHNSDSIARDRLRIDARKWQYERLSPRVKKDADKSSSDALVEKLIQRLEE